MVFPSGHVYGTPSVKACEVKGEYGRPLQRRPSDARLACAEHYGTLPTDIAVPAVVGETLAVAVEMLRAVGLEVGTTTEVTDAAAAGIVTASDPVPTTEVDLFSAVDLSYSDGAG